jgi:type IV pilus assembly protein PilA
LRRKFYDQGKASRRSGLAVFKIDSGAELRYERLSRRREHNSMEPHSLVAFRSREGSTPGFTLIEILVVVAVIGLLVAIAIPQFMNYRRQGVDAQMKSDLRNAAVAVESYYARRSIYPLSLAEVTPFGFQPTDGVTLSLVSVSQNAYTLTAAKPGGTQPSFTYQSNTGSIQ